MLLKLPGLTQECSGRGLCSAASGSCSCYTGVGAFIPHPRPVTIYAHNLNTHDRKQAKACNASQCSFLYFSALAIDHIRGLFAFSPPGFSGTNCEKASTPISTAYDNDILLLHSRSSDYTGKLFKGVPKIPTLDSNLQTLNNITLR